MHTQPSPSKVPPSTINNTSWFKLIEDQMIITKVFYYLKLVEGYFNIVVQCLNGSIVLLILCYTPGIFQSFYFYLRFLSSR